jgi:chromosome segregation ATPase
VTGALVFAAPVVEHPAVAWALLVFGPTGLLTGGWAAYRAWRSDQRAAEMQERQLGTEELVAALSQQREVVKTYEAAFAHMKAATEASRLAARESGRAAAEALEAVRACEDRERALRRRVEQLERRVGDVDGGEAHEP